VLFMNAFDNCKKPARLTEKLMRTYILSYWVFLRDLSLQCIRYAQLLFYYLISVN